MILLLQITVILRPSNTSTRNNDPTQNNNNNNNNNNNDFNNNISKCYWKTKYDIKWQKKWHLFPQLWGCYCRPWCYMPPTGNKRSYEIIYSNCSLINYYRKNTKKAIFCTCNFGHVCAALSVMWLLMLWKVVIKIQYKHKQAYISTTIYQDTAEILLKRTYFVFAILDMCLLPKMFMPSKSVKGCS